MWFCFYFSTEASPRHNPIRSVLYFSGFFPDWTNGARFGVNEWMFFSSGPRVEFCFNIAQHLLFPYCGHKFNVPKVFGSQFDWVRLNVDNTYQLLLRKIPFAITHLTSIYVNAKSSKFCLLISIPTIYPPREMRRHVLYRVQLFLLIHYLG